MSGLSTDTLRTCLAQPAQLALPVADAAPDIVLATLLWVDDQHVALADHGTAAPVMGALLTHPGTAARYQLSLQWSYRMTEGALLDALRAREAAIASSQGRGGASDVDAVAVYRITQVTTLPGKTLSPAPTPHSPLQAVRKLSAMLAASHDLSKALDTVLDGLVNLLGIEQAMVLCPDESGRWLYTVASRGYPQSGVGSEVMVGDGVIGAAALYRSPVRLCGGGNDLLALRSPRSQLDADIPFPGLAHPQSQLAVPMAAGSWLAGVLYVESQQARRFSHDDEDALAAIGAQLGLAMRLLIQPADYGAPAEPDSPATPVTHGVPLTIRYFATTQSVFLGDDYLIKGVAGAVLWLLLNDCQQAGRTEFSNRELRLDPRLRLPELDDNLETRLLLLQRRLAERCQWLGIEKVGRGRFRLRLEQPVRLVDVESQPA
jgi:hypothetical protein